jgi:type III secretion protein R
MMVTGAPVLASTFFANFGVTAVIALVPFLVIAGTSFVKISLVLAILRSALGAPGVPPTSVLTALSVVLSMFVMAPVGEEMLRGLEGIQTLPVAHSDPLGFSAARTIYGAAVPPLIDFLKLNTPASEIDFFASLAGSLSPSDLGLRVLLPAFAAGEIVEAFVMGFLLFIPFMVIDLVVANTLLAMGMHMIAPVGVALPLKLLLFVVVDGWHVLMSGLLLTYSI